LVTTEGFVINKKEVNSVRLAQQLSDK